MKQGNFIEDPNNRSPEERGILCDVLGEQYSSIFIQVTQKTFFTKCFQEWLQILLVTRTTLDCETRIVILRDEIN